MIEYRRATENDIEQLAKFRVRQLIDEGYQPTKIERELRQYFSDSLANGSLICWVGTVNKEVVATAALCFYQLPPSFSNPSGRVAHITNIYTVSTLRRQGIASHLVQVLLDEAKALNYTSVRLHASNDGRNIYV